MTPQNAQSGGSPSGALRPASKSIPVGIACALAGGALWGFSGSCSQLLLDGSSIEPGFITMVRTLIASVLFAILLAATRRDTLHDIAADRTSCKQLIVFGLSLFLCQITYVTSIGFTNAGTATVLQTLNVAFTLILTCVFVRRLPHRQELLALACAIVGVWLIATKGDFGVLNIAPLGLFWGLATAAAGTFYIMYPAKLFARWDSVTVTGLGMMVGSLFAVAAWLIVCAVSGEPVIPALGIREVGVLLIIGVVGTFAAFGLYLYGVSIVGSVAGSMLGTVEPAAAMVLSAVWLGTAFTGADWLGFALMVAMIFLVALFKSKTSR